MNWTEEKDISSLREIFPPAIRRAFLKDSNFRKFPTFISDFCFHTRCFFPQIFFCLPLSITFLGSISLGSFDNGNLESVRWNRISETVFDVVRWVSQNASEIFQDKEPLSRFPSFAQGFFWVLCWHV